MLCHMQPPNFRINKLVELHSKELKICFAQISKSFLFLKHWVWQPSKQEMEVQRKHGLIETSIGSFMMQGSLCLACPSAVPAHALTQIRKQHLTLTVSVCRHWGCISQILSNTLICTRIFLLLSHRSTEIYDFLKYWQIAPLLKPCWKI